MAKILVTGGAGFLGKHVVHLLQSLGNQVGVVDNIDPICGGDASFPHSHLDIRDFRALEDFAINGGYTKIVNLAAYGRNLSCQDYPSAAWNVNVNGTLNVLEVARTHPSKIQRVVCCSSNIVLSDQVTVYKETKLAVEALVKLYSTMGVPCIAIRPSNIYGEGQSKIEYQPCAFAGLDKTYIEKKYFTITGDGTQSRDWVHAKDVAKGIEAALVSTNVGMTVDICTGVLASMNTIASMLGVMIKYVPARPGDAKVLISDPHPAIDLLGFKAKIALKDAIWDAFPGVKNESSNNGK